MSSRSNIRKRGTTWTYYVYVTAGDGHRRQASKGGFRTRKEAEAARIAALAALQNGTWVRAERVTVREYLEDEWLPTQAPPTLEESTYRSYRRYVRLHVVPYIGGLPLQQLTPLDLTAMYRSLLESGRRPPTPPKRVHTTEVGALIDRLRADGLSWDATAGEVASAFPDESDITRHAVAALHRRRQSPPQRPPSPAGLKPRTVLYVHSIVHAALKDAMRWNRVARNVADAATPPPLGSTRQGRRTTWTAAQLGAFLDFIADDRYLGPWIFVATTGCRRGECLGLRWSDLDFDRSTAVISRQVTSIDHTVVVKDLPKTKRGHMVALDTNTVAMLRRWRAQQGEERLLVGPGYVDQGYVFCKPDGTAYDPDRFSREFLRKQEQYNRLPAGDPLPRLTLHGLRHTWATLALREGIDIKVVSDRLNHSSTFVTREIYTHVTPPMQSDAAERVAAKIFGSR
ncbi:MAG: site-specific integrase [Actinomycetota bacterium]|nr:site-specific integrase [Actinomycetota bacterium]